MGHAKASGQLHHRQIGHEHTTPGLEPAYDRGVEVESLGPQRLGAPGRRDTARSGEQVLYPVRYAV